jgi:hypothetical protein
VIIRYSPPPCPEENPLNKEQQLRSHIPGDEDCYTLGAELNPGAKGQKDGACDKAQHGQMDIADHKLSDCGGDFGNFRNYQTCLEDDLEEKGDHPETEKQFGNGVPDFQFIPEGFADGPKQDGKGHHLKCNPDTRVFEAHGSVSAPAGSEVRAIAYGRIAWAGWMPHYGNLMVIEHGNEYYSLYGHNQALLREVGEWVGAGEVIAQVGDSGGQARSALYFELRRGRTPLNPQQWLVSR